MTTYKNASAGVDRRSVLLLVVCAAAMVLALAVAVLTGPATTGVLHAETAVCKTVNGAGKVTDGPSAVVKKRSRLTRALLGDSLPPVVVDDGLRSTHGAACPGSTRRAKART